MSYDDWKLRSDRDEQDEPWTPRTVVVQCLRCEREMDVEADDRGPYRCAHCTVAVIAHATDVGRRIA